MTKRALTVQEVARRLRVTEATVRNMIRDGRLRAFRTDPGQGGHYRIWPEEVERFVREHETVREAE